MEAEAERNRKGAAGERRLRALLEPVVRAGYWLLDDLSIPDTVANIDLVAVGPAGVVILDAKNWSGTVEVARGQLRQNGFSRSDEVAGVAGQAEVVRRELAVAGGPHVPVWPVLCLVGDAALSQPVLIEGVTICSKHHVGDLIVQAPATLDSAWIEWCVQILGLRFPPRTARLGGEIVAPEEPVVFLNYWKKGRRYYLKDEEGRQGGYLDLVKGEAVGDSPVAEQVARQLLPHVADDAGLSEADLRGLRRFLAALRGRPARQAIPLVVGLTWQRFGRNRLYVFRLAADGTKEDLGWYDREDGRVYEAGEHHAVVRYCGRRYDAIDLARRRH